MSIGESRDLQSTSNEKISTSHRKSGQIGINQDFEFQFNKNTFDKGKETSTSNYLNGIKTSLNSDNVPVYKIDGKDSNKIRSELEKRGVDSKKENRKMTSNIPLTSSSRVLYGRYFVK